MLTGWLDGWMAGWPDGRIARSLGSLDRWIARPPDRPITRITRITRSLDRAPGCRTEPLKRAVVLSTWIPGVRLRHRPWVPASPQPLRHRHTPLTPTAPASAAPTPPDPQQPRA